MIQIFFTLSRLLRNHLEEELPFHILKSSPSIEYNHIVFSLRVVQTSDSLAFACLYSLTFSMHFEITP